MFASAHNLKSPIEIQTFATFKLASSLGSVFIFFLSYTNGSSQGKLHDDYSSALLWQSKSDAKLIERSRSLLSREEYDSALYFLSEAKLVTVDSAILSKCFRLEGQIHYLLNAVTDAEISAKRALELLPAKGNTKEACKIYNILGSTHTLTGNFEKAFSYYSAGLVLAEETEHDSSRDVLLANLGFLYYKIFDYRMAANFWTTVLNLYPELDGSDDCRINLALAYLNLGDYEKSSVLIREVNSRPSGLTHEGRINLYYTMGTLLDSLGKVDSAKTYFQKSYVMAKTISPRFSSENLLSLARVQRKLNNSKTGEQFLDSAETIARAHAFQDILLRSLRERIRFSTIKGDLIGAIQSQHDYMAQRKTFYDLNMTRIAAIHKQKIRLEEHGKKIKIYKQQLKATTTLAKLHKRFQVIVLVIGLMLFALIVLSIYQMSIRSKHESILERAVQARTNHWDYRNTAIMEVLHHRKLRKQQVEWALSRIARSFEDFRSLTAIDVKTSEH